MLDRVSWNLTRKRRRYERADVIGISLGKSGRTWLRVMLNRYLSVHFGVPFDPIRMRAEDGAFPTIEFTHELATHLRDGRRVRQLLGRSIVPARITDRKQLLVLHRDPRDVVVSSWFHKRFRSKRTDCTLEEFVRHPRWGIETLVHVLNRWRERFGDHPRSHWTSYEAFRASPHAELERLVVALALPEDPKAIDEAVEFGRFDRMQAAEARGEFESDRLRPGDPSNPDSFKVRRGEVGGYRSYLQGEDREWVDAAVARLDPFYGYRP